ncbi:MULTISPECIES: universal stress protein [Halorubrum]|jgi:nucleotide-binding universal stress UspA family protein|uniref:Universal stress protein UspA n=1 Tax=Halorubrum tropicale TaxID=1765655 RepID=A0A0M9AQ05_9EURY|nr:MULTISPECIES: universal stress protein [Halorubrum]KOX96527.1 universal stress protein UspA [Halorubrum tropicale]RLM52485.1 universal stress protein [Halorubrum sp. Atlit-28R]TKX44225.1 universal stress protein [Halorubrum sp. ARQ200]TKX50867.1 universal stress protein [Halorubrum sp. ASP121]TKX63559.1 universal stress protein [Halorubrum sp. ASP1]
MYDAILCPTDGSAGSAAATEQACGLAALTGARVHALFVVDEGIAGADEWDVVVEREEARGERVLDAVAEAAATRDVECERRLRRGRPHEEILDAAADYGVDLIVMGTHGRTGIGRFIAAGSVAERVVRYSELPVLTARVSE